MNYFVAQTAVMHFRSCTAIPAVSNRYLQSTEKVSAVCNFVNFVVIQQSGTFVICSYDTHAFFVTYLKLTTMPTPRNLNRREFLCFGVAPVMSVVPVKSSETKQNKVRRIVTGIDAEGKSEIISDDGSLQVANHFETDGFQIRTIWLEKKVPVNMVNNTETLDGYTFSFEPPKAGVIVLMVTSAPGHVGQHHKTQTIDFIFIISGSIELIMDKGKTVLSAGDTVVQRATFHTWRVIGDEPCKFAAVLVGAEE